MPIGPEVPELETTLAFSLQSSIDRLSWYRSKAGNTESSALTEAFRDS